MTKLAIIIPAYNEEKTIAKVVSSLPKKLAGVDIITSIVINDGSTDTTRQEAAEADVVLSHPVNLGVGAATISGFEYAKKENFDIVVTLDADGQHNSRDIAKLIEPISKDQADIVSGSRMIGKGEMPGIKKIGNNIMNVITYLVLQKWAEGETSRK